MENISTILQRQSEKLKNITLLDLFKQDPDRANSLCVSLGGLTFDYSRNHIDQEAFNCLNVFADKKNIKSAIAALLDGERINNTEKRSALHSALRAPASNTKISQLVQQTLDKVNGFVESIHQQQWLGYSGKPITAVVNIGIGGSDLGPRMIAHALSAYHVQSTKVYFVANIDGADLEDTLVDLNPETTLFIIASKTFTTLETLSNANSARQWVLDSGCRPDDLRHHFVSTSSNTASAVAFGIAEENIFPMWDWVGGRYSLWSAIGLSIAVAIGMDNFRQLLAGAHTMDTHFREAPVAKNAPVIAALLSYWYSCYWGATSHAVLPYAQRLAQLPAYLQQLHMESLGKRVTKAGSNISHPTGLVIWGTEGTNGQHSSHQLLHQGTQLIPVDFIAVKQAMSRHKEQHRQLLACCISQSQALLQGKTLAQAEAELRQQGLSEAEIRFLAPHKVVPGNKPSTIIVMDKLTPSNLGSLLAFYEHKVYASSVLLDINAFDQWGVELGKQLGKPVYTALQTGQCNREWDSATIRLIKQLR